MASRLLRLLAPALLVFGFALTGWVTGIAHADSNTAGADRFGACLASQKAGDLLLLMDESGSLKATDAQAARVQAAKYLVDTLGRYADRTHSELDVAIAGFSDGYTVRSDWSPLTEASADSVKGNLDTLAGRNDGLDTDYRLALDGARQTLASHTQSDPNRCQAISWFSDGKLDYSLRPGSKPYAPDVDLGTQAGVDAMISRATEGICRDGGVADQLRSDDVVMLAVGLGDGAASNADFDVMSAIATGTGLNGKKCGDITDPKPGDFYPVSNIDQMLFAFDALNPDPHVNDTKPVCQGQVCQEARHNFVLDRSVKAVNILGSGGIPGIMPYLISPSGEQLQLPKEEGKKQATIDGMPVQFEWQSDSAQTVSIQSADNPKWPGQWAIVYVDTTGQHGDAVSRVNIHISTDIYPALQSDPDSRWRGGQVMKGVKFGLADGAGKPVDPNILAGDAVMSASLAVDGAAPIEVLTSVPKTALSDPVDVDLTNVMPGSATLRMSLVITTAPAVDLQGAEIAAGTKLSPQQVDSPMQILPKVGLPVPGEHVEFGTVQGTNGATAQLEVTGPGCVWITDGAPTKVVAGPEDIGTVSVTSTASGPGNCLNVDKDQKATLPVTLHTERDGHGGLNGTVPVHIASQDNPDDAQTVEVTFVASMIKPLSTTNFVLVFIAALLLGPGIPLALLYAAKWYTGKIPGVPMLAERIPVEVDAGAVLRNGQPFAMADTDLVTPVPGLSGGARNLTVHGVELSTVNGRSPFGTAHVKVTAPGSAHAGSELPSTDSTGVQAVLPLAVHGKWLVLHDPRGPQNRAEVLLMVRGQSDIPERQKLYEDIERRLPELLAALRQCAAGAQLPPSGGPAVSASPFGADAATQLAGADPFGHFGAGPAPSATIDPYARTGIAGMPGSPVPSATVDPYGQTGVAPMPQERAPRGTIDPYAETQQTPIVRRPGYPPEHPTQFGPGEGRPPGDTPPREGRDSPDSDFDPFGGT